MAKLSEIDWNLLKFEFEVLGKSLEELADSYEINASIMAYQAKDWKQSPASIRESLQFTKLDSITELSEEIASQVKNEAEIISLIKQKFLLPKYVQLENILLEKSIALASSLESTTTGSASAIRTLTSTLMDLLKNNPILAPKEEEDTPHEGTRDWTVTFVDAPTTSPSEAGPVPDEEQAL